MNIYYLQFILKEEFTPCWGRLHIQCKIQANSKQEIINFFHECPTSYFFDFDEEILDHSPNYPGWIPIPNLDEDDPHYPLTALATIADEELLEIYTIAKQIIKQCDTVLNLPKTSKINRDLTNIKNAIYKI